MSLGSAFAGTALYVLTAGALAFLAQRFIRPFSKTALLILLLLPLCFTGKALLTGRVYAPIDFPYLEEPLASFRHDFGVTGVHNGMLSDVYSLNIPWKYAARLAILRGEWPLWNPYVAAGDILAAAAQPTPYEPLFLVSLLLPMPASLTFLAAMTLFLAALLMFVFLREIACSEWAALVGATAWTFSMFLVFFLDWVITPTSIWLPLVLLGVRRIVRSPGSSPMAILTVAFSMMLLNGHPESALHIVAVGMIWAAAELGRVRFRGAARSIPLAIASGAFAIAITAMYLLPILEAIPQTSEQRFRESTVNQPRSAPTTVVHQKLLRQFVPFIVGEPQREWRRRGNDLEITPESAYVGSAALALAVFGLWRSRWRGKWLVGAFVLFGVAIGIQLAPLGEILAKLPLFNIAINERLILAAVLGLSILAALGYDAMVKETGWWRPVSVALAILAVLAVLCADQYPGMRARGLTTGYLSGAIVRLLVPLILVAGACLLRRRPVALGFALLLIIAGERTLQSGDFWPTLSARMFYPMLPLLGQLQHGGEPYRIVGVGSVLPPNVATMYQLEDIREYSAMTFAPHYDLQFLWSNYQPVWSNRVESLTAPFLSLLNVRYAIADRSFVPPLHWSFVAADRGSQLLENQNVLPRAFIPKTVLVGENPLVSFGDQIRSQDDFGARSWIVVPDENPREQGNGPGSLTVREEGMGALSIQSHLEANAWVVVSEMAWKGWRAHVDGKPARLRVANGMLLAMYLPVGDHRVRLDYWPRSFVVGRAISAITLLLLAGGPVVMLWRRRRQSKVRT